VDRARTLVSAWVAKMEPHRELVDGQSGDKEANNKKEHHEGRPKAPEELSAQKEMRRAP
jgi:hypothetical protein